jgi:hypothetical protein
MKPQRTLFIAFAVLAMAAAVWAQPASMQIDYSPSGGHALGTPCDTALAVPFADGTPILLYWDNNANGPDTSDQQPGIGTTYGLVNFNATTFNGVEALNDTGYFYFPENLTIRVLPRQSNGDTALYYLKVNWANTCWTSTDFLATRGAHAVHYTWADWTCADHACGTGNPPNAPTNVRATDDSLCLKVHVTWHHDSLDVLGFNVYARGISTPLVSALATERDAIVSADTDRPREYFVRAFNAWGESADSPSDTGSTYLIRFAPGAAGNISGQRLANTQFTIHFEQPNNQCAAGVKLYLLHQDPPHTGPWARYGTGPLASDSLVMQMSGRFPNVQLNYCRLLMVDSSWDRRNAIFTDTTDSVFHLGDLAVGDFANTLLPDRFGLAQNFPNPFNPITEIMFSIPMEAQVRIRIYNVMGQMVRTLTEQRYSTGIHQIMWNGTDDNGISVGAGVYFYRMEAQQYVQTKKMLLLK